MDYAIHNSNGKVWLFWENTYECEVISNKKQQITMKCRKLGEANYFWITTVYAKSTPTRRKKLWRSLEDIVSGPWSVLGDFNVILTPEGKKGGKPYTLSKSLDFLNCLEERKPFYMV